MLCVARPHLVLTLLALLSAAAAHADAPWRYRLQVIPGTPARVECTLELHGLGPTTPALDLEMAEGFAFARLPQPILDGAVKASAGSVALEVERPRPYAWRVNPKGAAQVTLRWSVPLTHREHELVRDRDEYEYPYVAADHGMLVTAALLLVPTNLPMPTARVELGLPDGWGAIAPWKSVAANTFEVSDRRSLLNDLLAIGNWLRKDVRVGDFHCVIALAPGQERLAAAVVDPVAAIVAREIEIFDRPMSGEYLFLFGHSSQQGLGGSPKTRSMTLYVNRELAERASGHVHHLIAHEFFHLWNPGELPIPGDLRWLGEGITDYFAFRVLPELGLSTWDAFAAELAQKMRQCEENPLRGKMSLAEAGGEGFFGGGPPYDLVYHGGLLVGAWLDRSLRNLGEGRSLDALLRRFLNAPRARGAAPTLAEFVALVAEYANPEIAAKLEKLVREPYGLDPVALFAEAGLPVERRTSRAAPQLRANLERTRIVDIDPTSWAARMGLRAGDELVEINGRAVLSPKDVHAAWSGSGDGPLAVTLRRDGTLLTLREKPPAATQFVVPTQDWSPPRAASGVRKAGE